MADSTTTEDRNDVFDFGDEWLIKVYVPADVLRSLSGFHVDGIEPSKRDESKTDLVRGDWLDKCFGCFIPKQEGVYNITAWGEDGPSSSQYKVTGNGARASIEKMSYRDALAHFGDDSATKQATAAKRGSTVVTKGSLASAAA